MENAILLSLVTTRSTQEASIYGKFIWHSQNLIFHKLYGKQNCTLLCVIWLFVACTFCNILIKCCEIDGEQTPKVLQEEVDIQTYVIPQEWHLHWRHCTSRRKQIDGEYFILM